MKEGKRKSTHVPTPGGSTSFESLLTVTSTLEVALLFKNNMTNNRKTAFSSLHHPIRSSFKQALVTAMLSLTSLFYLVGKCDSKKSTETILVQVGWVMVSPGGGDFDTSTEGSVLL